MVHSAENLWSSSSDDEVAEIVRDLGQNFILLPQTQQLKALHTVVRDK